MPDDFEPYRDAPPRRWPTRYGAMLVLTAVIAAAAGFLAVLAVRDLSARPAAAHSVAPAGIGGVKAGIGGVKAGDEVSLQATGTGGKLTATAIQDPASIP